MATAQYETLPGVKLSVCCCILWVGEKFCGSKGINYHEMTFHFLQQTTWILRKHHEGKYSSPIIPPYQGGAVSYFLQVLSHLLICPPAAFHSSISHLHLHHCSRLAESRTTSSRLCQFSNLRFSKTQLKLVKTVKHSIISQLYQPGQTIADITAFQRHF